MCIRDRYNTSGYKLQVSGEYDTSLPWYKQRNGNYRGESSSEVDCNISDGYIGWGGYIDYYDSSYHYFITNVSAVSYTHLTLPTIYSV